MNREKKKIRWSKAKAKKCMNGSISVLLCLLLTPFLTVTLALIEYARYQEVMEIADELMELTELFALADYDKYIHSRFGMLAVSQDGTLGDGLEDVLKENAKITGNQLVPGNVTVKGQFNLRENEILRQQLVDFGQLTSPAALVMEEFGLEKLLKKLDELKTFSNFKNTVGNLAEATGKVTEAVKALQKLRDDLDALKTNVEDTVTQAKELAGKCADLVNSLGTAGITLPDGASPEAVQETVQKFIDGGYLDQIKDIYKRAGELRQRLDNIKSAAGDIKSDASTVKDAVKDASKAIKAVKDKNNTDEKSESISKAMTTTVDSVVQEMDTLVQETLDDLIKETVTTVETAMQEVIDRFLDGTGISDVLDKYNAIAYGSYFSVDDGTLTVSDEARKDITDFIKMAQGVYNDARSGGGDIMESIKSYFRGRFFPDLSFPSDLLESIDEILKKASSSLEEKVKGRISDLIEKLSNLLSKIISFTAFYDPRLHAVVTLENQDQNGNQKFIDAMKALSSAIDKFKSSIAKFDFLQVLGAIRDMLNAIKAMFEAIFDKIENVLTGIGGLLKGGGEVYDRVIISEYMVHSMPCRTDAKAINNGKVTLDGKTLTGYDFNDIPRGNVFNNDANTFNGAELEYIYAGTNDETANQTFAFWDIYFLRLLINLPVVFSNGEVASLAAAFNIAAWVIYIVYILAEPFLDTLLLVNGVNVPVLKSTCWLTASGIEPLITKLANAVTECEDLKKAAGEMADGFAEDMKNLSGGGGGNSGGEIFDLSYKNYLLIMLMISVDTNNQVQRLGNLIDLEATQYYQEKDKSFNINQTYTALELSADMTFNPFVDMGILAGDGPLNLTGHMTRTVSY